jgi:hypothetical protein
MAQALQRETATLVAWISATGTSDSRTDTAPRTSRRAAVISHSAWFNNSVRSYPANMAGRYDDKSLDGLVSLEEPEDLMEIFRIIESC